MGNAAISYGITVANHQDVDVDGRMVLKYRVGQNLLDRFNEILCTKTESPSDIKRSTHYM
jgi:hypothetical protein